MDARETRTHHLGGYLDFECRKVAYGPLLRFMEREGTPSHLQVLEVGCAAGAFLQHLRENPGDVRRVVGLDPDIEALAHARTEAVVGGSAYCLPFSDDSFDRIVMVSVLHHLTGSTLSECQRNWSRVLVEAGRVCRPGGYVLVREGLAVRSRSLQEIIYHVTTTLARLRIGVGLLHIEAGEVLAFLTPNDMLCLADIAPQLALTENEIDPRRSHEFGGPLGIIWRWKTCSLTAVSKCS